MNKQFLPFYNDLSQEDKEFWLECSKEELIDHFIANLKNADCLLTRINKAIDYIDNRCLEEDGYVGYGDDLTPEDLVNILRGDE